MLIVLDINDLWISMFFKSLFIVILTLAHQYKALKYSFYPKIMQNLNKGIKIDYYDIWILSKYYKQITCDPHEGKMTKTILQER